MNRLLPAIHNLSVAERIQLVEDIWDSLAAESPEALQLTPAQKDEVNRRLASHDRDPAVAVPWSEVRESLFKPDH